MDYCIEDMKKDINQILALCKMELNKISNGEYTEATKEQIENHIIPEMEQLIDVLRLDKIPPKGERWLLSVAYITRGWNWNINNCSELAGSLALLDNKYRYELE